MKKWEITSIIIAIIIIVALVIIFYPKLTEDNNLSLSRHTCLFNNETLDLNCSSEIRIKLGYERILTENPVDIGNGAVAYYYDSPIYSIGSSANLNEIYKITSDLYITNTEGQKYRQCSNCPIPTDQNPKEFLTGNLFLFRNIEAVDIETNETFLFFILESKIYELTEKTNYSIVLNAIRRCNEDMIIGNKSDWCTNYHDTYRECTYGSGKLYYCFSGDGKILMSSFGLSKEKSKELCYSFIHKGLTANCLRTLSTNQEEINECIDFASGDEYLLAICNLSEGNLNKSLGSKSIQHYI